MNDPGPRPHGGMIGPVGRSKAAAKRFLKTHRGTIFTTKNPGQIIEMSDRVYVVADDGALIFVRMKGGTAPEQSKDSSCSLVGAPFKK